MERLRTRNTLFVAFAVTIAGAAVATEAEAQTAGTCETPTAEAVLDVANVRATIYPNGNLFWRRGEPQREGYTVPKSGDIDAVFASGVWIGGMVDDELRVAAARYDNYQFWTGPLDAAADPPISCSRFDHIWSVRQTDLARLEATGEATADIATWPTGLGAPTLSPINRDGSRTASDGADNDSDGLIDELGEMRRITDEILALPLAERIDRVINLNAGERPDILGDQMLWWIMNDVGNEKVFAPPTSSANAEEVSPPIGLEVHASAFAFAIPGDVKNATFYRLRIFNKSPHDLTDAYLGLFGDVDIGNFDDDYIASDTVSGLGIVYNADNYDEGGDGYGDAPPAIAFSFLQGPVVESLADTAFVFGDTKPGFRKLQMTSFIGLNNAGGPFGHPSMPIHYYYNMQAIWGNGRPLTMGDQGSTEGLPVTKFMYPADPNTGEFWSEFSLDGGHPLPPADRVFVMGAGPFKIPSMDEQDIFYAISWARGKDNLDSYTETKEAARRLQRFMDSGLPSPSRTATAPTEDNSELAWSTIHPNPSYGAATLQFSLSTDAIVAVEIYNLLGRRVAMIAQGQRNEGPHSFELDTTSWPAGVYFLRLQINRYPAAQQQFVVN